jgi:hypothetical protein
MNLELKFHHTAIVVKDMELSRSLYGQLFGDRNLSQVFNVTSQGVLVSFVQIGDNCFIELVQPSSDDSPINRLLSKHVSYYHMAFVVDHFDDTVKRMEQLNYKMLTPFHSEAFANKRCIFCYSPDAHLLELIEA